MVLSRDLDRVIRRFRVDDDGIANVDGISLLAGSGHLLLLSTFDRKAALFTSCHVYRPRDGEIDSCACLLPPASDGARVPMNRAGAAGR